MKSFTEFFNQKKKKITPLLLPERHPNRDFFIADIFDNLPIKDDVASMEHPIFSLSTKKDLRDLVYNYKNKETEQEVNIKIKPNSSGLPTIFDKDILLYCGSLLMAEVNKGLIPPKTIRISTHDLLVTINRVISGDSYKKIKNALERLKGVSITTDIKTNKRTQSSGFGLIDSYNIIKSSKVKDRIVRLEITLSDWFYNSIIGKEVLTINRGYFRLRQPLERRIYELARKHCGTQDQWQISVEALHKKTGSRSSLPKFFFSLKKITAKNILPDYYIFLEKNMATFKPRNQKLLASQQKTLENNDNYKPVVSISTLEKAKEMTITSRTGWDFYAIVEEFTQFSMQNPPNDYNKAFLGFVKKKVANRP